MTGGKTIPRNAGILDKIKQNKTGNKASRLDKFFINSGFKSLFKFDHVSFSEHLLVQCSVNITGDSGDFSRKSFWKMNISVLEEKSYVLKIKELLTNTCTLKDLLASRAEWWDDLKNKIKLETIKYCKAKKRDSKWKENNLKNELAFLNLNPSINSERIVEIKDLLRILAQDEVNGLAARSRVDRKDLKTTYFK